MLTSCAENYHTEESNISLDASSKEVSNAVASAADTWSLRERLLWSHAHRSTDLRAIDARLAGLLDVLRTYGRLAIPAATERVEHDETAKNIFVLTYTLVHAFRATELKKLERLLINSHKLTHGARAALIMSNQTRAEFIIDRWWFSAEPSLREAVALPALCHARLDTDTFIRGALSDANPRVRSQVYRYIGDNLRINDKEKMKTAFLQESDASLFEAAASLAMLGDFSSLHYLPYAFQTLRGHDLRRLVMIWSVLSYDQDFEAWCAKRIRDLSVNRTLIWAIAFRGDILFIEYLDRLIKKNIAVELARYAQRHILGEHLDPGWSSHFTYDERYLDGSSLKNIDSSSLTGNYQPQVWQKKFLCRVFNNPLITHIN